MRKPTPNSTVQDWLDNAGFDWNAGVVIVHEQKKEWPGYAWREEITCRRFARRDDPLLTKLFDNGYGGPRCPRFVAYDAYWIYYPSQYDGSTECNVIARNPNKYLENDSMTPYPGGG